MIVIISNGLGCGVRQSDRDLVRHVNCWNGTTTAWRSGGQNEPSWESQPDFYRTIDGYLHIHCGACVY